MTSYENGGILVEDIHELPPSPRNIKRLFIDVETTSGDPRKRALDPWHGSKIAGVAVTWDDEPRSWYVPVRHSAWSVPVNEAMKWVRDLLESANLVINHNVKFDAHHLALDDQLGFDFKSTEMIDTIVEAKLVRSDEPSYALDHLSAAWLGRDASKYSKRLSSHLAGSLDYGDADPAVIAEYSCEDVLAARLLLRYCEGHLPEYSSRIRDVERRVTGVLFDAERSGMMVDQSELRKWQYALTAKVLQIEEELHSTSGHTVNPRSNDSCYDLLINAHGLPVLSWTDSSPPNPSFDAEAMKRYSSHPLVAEDKRLSRIVRLIMKHRETSKLLDLYVIPYQEKASKDNLIHPRYNQCVRTGRMSCSNPNAQQLSTTAKRLIHPREAFLCWDYSQIEFRIIVHYCGNVAATRAYRDDPDTDFHAWVAEMTNLERGPAKNVNFAMGFGAGKKKTIEMLIEASPPGTPHHVSVSRANAAYERYHDTIPEIRWTSNLASAVARRRGYVKNLYGRTRYIPEEMSRIAFNAVVQSSAADVMKERLVAIAPRYCSLTRRSGATITAVVHDEILMDLPEDVIDDVSVVSELGRMLENISVPMNVPIMITSKRSSESWGDVVEFDWRCRAKESSPC